MRRGTSIPIDATSGRPCWSFRGILQIKRLNERKENCASKLVLGKLVIHTQHGSP